MKKLLILLILSASPSLIAQSLWDSTGTNIYYTAGNVGIGTTNPQERFHVASGGSMRLDNQGRYFITRSNVTSEMFTATNGQGSGWMINATYGGSGNPQGNSTFSIDPGQHNTAAGYLDFDGNSKNWSFNLSATSTGIGNSVSWKRVAFFDDSEITLSPTGSSTHFNIRSNGNVGIGTDNATRLLHVKGSTTDVVSAFESTDSGTQIVLTDNSGSLRFGTLSNGAFALSIGGDASSTTGANVTEAMRVTSVGNVGIGTTTPGNELEVNGTARAKEVIVEATGWPDYVFSPEYELWTLAEIEAHIKTNGHLPEVPTAKEVEEEGQHLGEMQQLLLKKIEEMTLHLIELKKENEALKERVETLEKKNEESK